VKALSAQAIITVNYGSGTPQMAANWVAAAKAQNYPFRYWEVGNENYGSWEVDWQSRKQDPVVYANRFVQYMR
jgi:alpha-N-arabinofuranosidase